jgi:hypothetical protein
MQATEHDKLTISYMFKYAQCSSKKKLCQITLLIIFFLQQNILQRLDIASLQEKHKITLPFVKDTLNKD